MVNWKEIHKDFENNPKLISEWEEFGFGSLECEKWINVGLRPYEAKYAFCLRVAKDYTPKKLTKKEIEKVWEIQSKLVKLEIEVENKLEAKVEISKIKNIILCQ